MQEWKPQEMTLMNILNITIDLLLVWKEILSIGNPEDNDAPLSEDEDGFILAMEFVWNFVIVLGQKSDEGNGQQHVQI